MSLLQDRYATLVESANAMDGVYLHPLKSFLSKLAITGKGENAILKVTLEFPVEEILKDHDLRALGDPNRLTMLPLIVLVDSRPTPPELAEKTPALPPG